MKDRTEYGIGADGQDLDWATLPWSAIEERVRKLRRRIFRATREQKWNVVRSLMKLMLRSYSNLLLSVRQVTQKNKGKKTAGVDAELALNDKARLRLVRTMGKYQLWQAKPARRVYIPKPGKPGQRRPLGIPTLRNRVAQAMLKNALEPSWEARFEPHSYGFRPGRSLHDAVRECWLLLKGNSTRPWVLDADIRGAFDNVNHEHIMQAVGHVPGHELLNAWLRAGYMEAEMLHATERGTPQGGIISPLLLNIALHGMHDHIGKAYGFVRYADDFVVVAKTREALDSARTALGDWLSQRGLELHPEKTRIVHINDGFNFLSFSFRQYRGKCLFKPEKAKVLAFLSRIRLWLNKHKQTDAEHVIHVLNPILRGWCNHYRHAVSSATFGYVQSEIWKALWRWCLRRHPNKSKVWVRKKYFCSHLGYEWTFYAQRRDERNYLYNVGAVTIERHIKVRGAASPDDPAFLDYWRTRKDERNARMLQRKVAAARRHAALEARAE